MTNIMAKVAWGNPQCIGPDEQLGGKQAAWVGSYAVQQQKNSIQKNLKKLATDQG